MPKKKSKVPYIPKMDLQFFGRIRKMELACPDCGAMHELREGSQYWNSHGLGPGEATARNSLS